MMSCLHLLATVSFVSLVCVYAAGEESDDCAYKLEDRKSRQLTVASGDLSIFCLNIVAPHVTHIVFQAHIQRGNLTVSLDPGPEEGRFVIGKDVGVISMVSREVSAKWYLTTILTPGASGQIIVMATTYQESDPIPGGCNMELPLENDPNIYLHSPDPHLTTIQFAYANSAIGRQCGSVVSQNVSRYDVYQFFMNERDLSEGHFMDVMENMMQMEFIQRNAYHVTSLEWHDLTEMSFGSYRGLGTVLAVVVTVNWSNRITQASYIPTVTYSCNDLQDGCVAEGEFASKIVVTILSIIGLFICFCGHRFFKIEMFFIGYLAVLLIAFIVITRFTNWGFSTCLYVSLGVAALGGIAWLLFWVFLGYHLLSVLLAVMLLGYLLASIIFNASPIGLYQWCRVELNYQLLFFSLVLAFCVIFIAATRVINVLFCALIGSFFIVLTTDICIHGAFKYILLNTIWRSTVPGFVSAFSILPIQATDIILYVLWGLLAIAGLVVHYFLERRRPPFPECPWELYQRSRFIGERQRSELERLEDEENEDGEHRPLLFSPRRSYETRDWRQQPVEQLGQPADSSGEWWHLPSEPVSPRASPTAPVVSSTATPPPAYSEAVPVVAPLST